MSKPPDIIGQSHGHTVSLPEGSNVAARKTARKPEGGEVPATKARTAPRQVAAAPKPARAAASATKPAAARRSGAAQGLPSAALPEEPMPLGEAILRRIAELQQSNDAVRAQFDRLAATRSAAADSWSLL